MWSEQEVSPTQGAGEDQGWGRKNLLSETDSKFKMLLRANQTEESLRKLEVYIQPLGGTWGIEKHFVTGQPI